MKVLTIQITEKHIKKAIEENDAFRHDICTYCPMHQALRPVIKSSKFAVGSNTIVVNDKEIGHFSPSLPQELFIHTGWYEALDQPKKYIFEVSILDEFVK
jgi:hypothetical protein